MVIIAHPEVSVDALSLDQIRGIFAGRLTNWREVGGGDLPIVVLLPWPDAIHRMLFEKEVMNHDPFAEGAIDPLTDGTWLLTSTGVSKTPGSISFTFGGSEGESKVIEIAGAELTDSNVRGGIYPLVLDYAFVLEGKPSDLVSSWMDFIFSADGQAIIRDTDYVPALREE